MIDQLRTMAIFQVVAELGSFRAAAKKLGLSPSVISHHVAQLEEHLGTALLYRSTRRMSLTDAGTDLLAASQRMTAAAQEGLAALARRAEQPVGKLSITMNSSSAAWPYSRIYSGFARAFPKVELSFHVSDHEVSLEGSQFDVAIRGRTRDLDDSSYVARPLGRIDFCLFASPDYVRARPPLTSLDDLADWDRIVCPQVSWARLVAFDGRPLPEREPRVAMSCDNYTLARTFVDEGLGFMVETVPLVAEDFRKGRLIRLLPEVELRGIDVYAIYPANSPRSGLARLLVEYMQQQDWLLEMGFERA